MVFSHSVEGSKQERLFVFTFNSGKEKKTLRLNIDITEAQNCEELTARLSGHHNIPCYVEEELKCTLQDFITTERIKLTDETASLLIKKFEEKPENLSKIAKNVASKYKKTWAEIILTDSTSEQVEEFSTMYHRLIHSQAMTLLLGLEENYYRAVKKIVSDQENSMTRLRERQELEMQRTCEHVSSGSLYTEDDVNTLAQRHASDAERLLGEWKSKYSKLVSNQRKEFREAVTRLYGEMQANHGEVDENGQTYIEVKKIIEISSSSNDKQVVGFSEPHYEPSPSRRFPRLKGDESTLDSKQMSNDDHLDTASFHEEFTPRLEESFTINLGAQMKTMHNIRLVAAPILHYCRHSNQSGDVQAQRLQTVLSLYSNSLSGIVLLVDNNINSVSALKADFAAICQESTEFHFMSYDEQLAEIKCRKAAASLDKVSIKSEDTLSTDSSSSGRSTSEGDFQDGDFYLTKHSNLSRVHIVFHLAANITCLRSPESSSTVTSRHPVILGLRHILKVMSSHDVATLMIPILLCHELTDRIDEAWIVKRAELVMKCMKGFMMEMAAWDGGISRTIQFVLPPGISENAFYRLSAMLPEIFRTTTARDLTTNTPKKVAAPPSPRPVKR